MIYLASPYSHPQEYIRVYRFNEACRAAAFLTCQGRHVFSPIAHSHPIALHGLPLDAGYWLAFDLEMLGACQEIVVLRLDGWDRSVGVRAEVAKATEWGMPVSYMDPLQSRQDRIRRSIYGGVGLDTK